MEKRKHLEDFTHRHSLKSKKQKRHERIDDNRGKIFNLNGLIEKEAEEYDKLQNGLAKLLENMDDEIHTPVKKKKKPRNIDFNLLSGKETSGGKVTLNSYIISNSKLMFGNEEQLSTDESVQANPPVKKKMKKHTKSHNANASLQLKTSKHSFSEPTQNLNVTYGICGNIERFDIERKSKKRKKLPVENGDLRDMHIVVNEKNNCTTYNNLNADIKQDLYMNENDVDTPVKLKKDSKHHKKHKHLEEIKNQHQQSTKYLRTDSDSSRTSEIIDFYDKGPNKKSKKKKFFEQQLENRDLKNVDVMKGPSEQSDKNKYSQDGENQHYLTESSRNLHLNSDTSGTGEIIDRYYKAKTKKHTEKKISFKHQLENRGLKNVDVMKEPSEQSDKNKHSQEGENQHYVTESSRNLHSDSDTSGTGEIIDRYYKAKIKKRTKKKTSFKCKVKREVENRTVVPDYDTMMEIVDLASERFSNEHKSMLQNLVVHNPWPVPPSHLIETRMSTHPSKLQQIKFKEQGFNMKTDHYTSAEDRIIIDNWEQFCKLHNIPNDPEPFLAFEATRNSKAEGSVLSKINRINFVRFLGHNLPNRCLFSIYRRFKKLFGERRKGKFTPKEDTVILDFVKNSTDPNKFAQLAVILHRDRHAIMLRYKVLMKNSGDDTSL